MKWYWLVFSNCVMANRKKNITYSQRIRKQNIQANTTTKMYNFFLNSYVQEGILIGFFLRALRIYFPNFYTKNFFSKNKTLFIVFLNSITWHDAMTQFENTNQYHYVFSQNKINKPWRWLHLNLNLSLIIIFSS